MCMYCIYVYVYINTQTYTYIFKKHFSHTNIMWTKCYFGCDYLIWQPYLYYLYYILFYSFVINSTWYFPFLCNSLCSFLRFFLVWVSENVILYNLKKLCFIWPGLWQECIPIILHNNPRKTVKPICLENKQPGDWEIDLTASRAECGLLA